MSKKMTRSRLGLLVVGWAVFVAGCGDKLPPLTSVAGKVTVDGQPLTGGQVGLSPDKESSPDTPALMCVGTIDSSGNYKIYTSGKAGVPLGKYKVAVTPSMVPSGGGMPAPFDRKYTNPKTSGLIIQVVEGAAPGAYDLKLMK
jgi:hypothetical protein